MKEALTILQLKKKKEKKSKIGRVGLQIAQQESSTILSNPSVISDIKLSPFLKLPPIVIWEY